MNIDTFIKTVDTTIQRAAPMEDKLDHLTKWIDVNRDLLNAHHNPASAPSFQKLAERISQISVQDAEQRTRVQEIAKRLLEYAESFKLPPELMQKLFQQVAPKETLTLMKTSKETRQLAAAAYREWMKYLKIMTAPQVIQFAHQFGSQLTFLDVSGISFTKEQIQELLPLVPNLKTLYVPQCGINAEGVKLIVTHLRQLQELDIGGNYFRDEGAEHIAQAKLHFLNISSCGLSERGVQMLADSKTLTHLHTLILDNNHPIEGDQALSAIASSETLKNLRHLDLSVCGIGVAGLQALASSKINLETLILSANPIQDAGLSLIAGSPQFQNLKVLGLNDTEIGAGGIGALARSPHLKKLIDLDLAKNQLGDDAIVPLARAPFQLQRLVLKINKIGVAGAKALAASPSLQNLKELDLARNGIGKEGAKALAALVHLQKLNLQGNGIGDGGVIALARSLKNLQALELHSNSIGVKGAKALGASRAMQNLRLLGLHNNSLGDEGVTEIAASPWLDRLEELSLGDNGITSAALGVLAGWQGLKNLRKLSCDVNQIGDAGVVLLARSEIFKNLERLDLVINPIGDKGVFAIAGSRILKNLISTEITCSDKEAYALAQHKKLSQFSEEQWRKLYTNLCAIAIEDGVEEVNETWAKENLFKDRARFEKALRR